MRQCSIPSCLRLLLIAVAVVWIGGTGTSMAVEGRGRLTGKVVDETGNVLAGVKIKFVRAAGEQGRSIEATSDKKGKFLLGFFPAGTYQPQVVGGDLRVVLVKSSIGGTASASSDDGSNVTRQGSGGRGMDQEKEQRPGFETAGGGEGERGSTEGLIFEVPPNATVDIAIFLSKAGPAPLPGTPKPAEVVTVQPGEAPLECTQAVKALKAGKLTEAIAEADAVLTANPEPRTEGFALAVKGTAFWQTGDMSQAVGVLTRARELVPDYPGIHGLLGTVLIQAGDQKKEAGRTEEAVKDFNTAADLLEEELKRSPGSVGILNNRLAALERAGRNEEATTLLRELIAANPQDDRARLRLADFLTEAGQPLEALAELEKVTTKGEPVATSFYNAGVLLFNQGEMDSLLAALAKPLQNMPDQAILHNLAGRANLVKGNTEKAILEFKEFLRLDPDAPEAPDIKEILKQLEKGKPRK